MSDTELLKLFAERRDEAAFAEIVRRHGPMVMGVCRRVLLNAADAEDAFQATFLLLAMKASGIRDPNLLGNWLFGVAARISASSRRATRRRQRLEKRLMQMAQPTPPSSDPAAEREILQLLDVEIHRLAFKLRGVVVLCYLEGKTKTQAAKQLGWPEGTVATRLAEARKILRRRLAIKGIDSPANVLSAVLAQSLVAAPVSPDLVASTVKAAALVSVGKAAAAGAVSAKALGLAKGASNAMFAAKLKLVALVVMGFGLTLGVAAAVSQSQPVPKPRSVAQAPPAAPRPQSEADISATRTLRVLLAIDLYANEHNGHYPPDLGATLAYCPVPLKDKGKYYVLPVDELALAIPESPSPQWINEHTSFVYLADENLREADLRQLKPAERPIALVYQRPRSERGHPISVGFSDSGAGWFAPSVVRQYAEQSLAAIARVRPSPATKVKTIDGFAPDTTPQFAEPALPAEAIALPDSVRQALSQNAAELGPLSIRWTDHGTCDAGADFAKAHYFIYDGFLDSWRRKVVWQDGKVYVFSKSPNADIHESTFDGSQISFTNYHPKPGLLKRPISSSLIDKSLANNPNATWFGAEFFELAGLHVPVTPKQLVAGQAQSRILKMLDDGAKLVGYDQAMLDNQPMSRITLVGDNVAYSNLHSLPQLRTYVFWIDPQMNYALRRLEQKYADQPVEVTTNDRFEHLPGRSLWLPKRSRTDLFTFYSIPDQFFDHPILGRALEVSAMSIQPSPAEQFVLRPEVPAESSAENAVATAQAGAGEINPTLAVPRVTRIPRPSSSSTPLIVFAVLASIFVLAVLGRIALARFTGRRQRP